MSFNRARQMSQENVRPPHQFCPPWISMPEAQSRSRLVLGLCVGLVFVGLGCQPASSQAESLPWGRTVLDIRLESDARLKIDTFQGQITQRTGEALDRSK